jgi:hypothetical protein
MKRALALVVVLAAVGGVAALVLLAGDDPQPRAAPPAGDPVVLEATVSPARYAFGDPLVARIELVVDSSRVDPDSVVPAAFFRPFRRLGAVETERLDLGQTTVLRYDYHIQCVDRACVPRAAERTIELPIGLVRYSPREGDVVTVPLEWPAVEVSSYLTADERRAVTLQPSSLTAQAGTDDLPPLRFRGGSELLGWLLVGAAAAILLVVGAWLARRLWPRRAEELPPEEHERPPLAAALARLDWALAAQDAEEERRAALDVLARRLAEAGETELAREARGLAWSEAGPVPAPTTALARAARERAGAAA